MADFNALFATTVALQQSDFRSQSLFISTFLSSIFHCDLTSKFLFLPVFNYIFLFATTQGRSLEHMMSLGSSFDFYV